MELWRYPVKSMRGERCSTLLIDPRGVSEDRLFAVQNISGKIGSGKTTRRFVKIDGLLSLRASYRNGVPHVQLPDGSVFDASGPDIDETLSNVLGQPVRLVQEEAVSHFDAGPVHMLSHDSLANLGAVAPERVTDVRRFRPNIVLSIAGEELEQAWVGKRLRIGWAELEATSLTERCGMVSFAQGELNAAPGVLRHIVDKLDLKFGIYAQVTRAGAVKLGDGIEEIEHRQRRLT